MLKLFWALFPDCRPVDRRRSTGTLDADLTHKAARWLRDCGGDSLAGRVVVRWSRRLKTTAGLARYACAEVSLNPRLADFPDEIDRTLRHELAHLLAYERAGAGRRRIAAHGSEWRQACADLGIPGESRCHNLPLARRRQERRHTYRCPGCASVLQRVRPLGRRRLACHECCRRHAAGRFDARFEFVEVAAARHP